MIGAEHPEDALDRAISGSLLEAERGLLEQHLKECAACKAHLALARIADESFQPLPSDDRLDRLNIDDALARVMKRGRPLRSPVRKRVFWLGAAALLALGGIASAAWQHGVRAERGVEARAPIAQRAKIKDIGSADLREPLPRPIEPPLSVALDGAPIVPPIAPPPPDALAGSPIVPSASASATASANASARALFRKASALRANGEPDAAIAVFLKLQKLFPESRESRLSSVIVGRLLLERGHPAQALEQFDQYLTLSGVASEDALAGRAAALQSLERSDAEASTWQHLLSAYPNSVYGNRAKARLSEIRPTLPGSTNSRSPQ